LRFFVRCFRHLRSLRISPVARFVPAADQENKKAVARTIQRRLSRDSPLKFRLNHRLIWLMISYSRVSPRPSRRRPAYRARNPSPR
jgi:hypothetical protein